MTERSTKAVTVLACGSFNAHCERRLDELFQLVRIERADPGLLSPQMARDVRAVASFGGVGRVLIDALPSLEIIASFGVGYDSVDAAHAARCGVMVTNTPDVLTDEVADVALGLLISTARELPQAERYLREGRWRQDGSFRLSSTTLRGRIAGIFGLGRIGQAIARRLEAFGLPIAYHNRRPVEGVAYAYHPTLLSLAEAVDTLICVAPGGAATAHAVNEAVLRALGPDGIFINVGRGTTVDEQALVRALSDGTIRAAGLDVFENEPHVPQALIALPNAVLLPHVASGSHHTRNAMADLVVDNLRSWFGDGRPLTPVPETRHIPARQTASAQG